MQNQTLLKTINKEHTGLSQLKCENDVYDQYMFYKQSFLIKEFCT